jgi:hypothetical protein
MKPLMYAFSCVLSGALLLSCAKNCDVATVDMGEFSATVVRSVADRSFNGKMFFSKDKIRDESDNAGIKTVSIIRIDKGLCWVLMANNQYMEIASIDQKNLLPIEKQTGVKYEVKSLGRQTVNGFACDVKEYRYKEGDNGVTTQWYSPKLNYMIKTEHKKDGTVTFTQELTDIKSGKVDASLFEVPAGYVKFDPMSTVPAGMKDMVKGMMKNMMQGKVAQ